MSRNVPLPLFTMHHYNNNGGASDSGPVTLTAPVGRIAGNHMVAFVAASGAINSPATYSNFTVGQSKLGDRNATNNSSDDVVVDPVSAEPMYAGLCFAFPFSFGGTLVPPDNAGVQSVGTGVTSGNTSSSAGTYTAAGPGLDYMFTALAARGANSTTISSLQVNEAGWIQLAGGTYTTVQGKTGRYVLVGRRIPAAGSVGASPTFAFVKSDTNVIEGFYVRFGIT